MCVCDLLVSFSSAVTLNGQSALNWRTVSVFSHFFFLSFSQFRVFTAPFHKVGFADFWLADQLNSLSVILMDLEYMICFYSFELKWDESKGLLPNDPQGRV